MFCSRLLKGDTCSDFPKKTEVKDLIGINFLQVRELLGHLRQRFKTPNLPQVCFSRFSVALRGGREADQGTHCCRSQ